MNKKIVITELAERKLEKLFEYLIENWSLKVKRNFVKKLDDCISIIKIQPESFPESSKIQGLRRCVVTKQVTLYYKINKEKIYIVSIFGNRQNPEKLGKELK